MRDEDLLLGDPALDELDHLGRLICGPTVDREVLEGEVDRLHVILVQLRDERLLDVEAVGDDLLAEVFSCVAALRLVLLLELERLVGEGAQDEAVGNHERVEVELQVEGLGLRIQSVCESGSLLLFLLVRLLIAVGVAPDGRGHRRHLQEFVGEADEARILYRLVESDVLEAAQILAEVDLVDSDAPEQYLLPVDELQD